MAVQEEIERVVPLVERICGELGAVVSVDTYKPEVARAAVAAGARIVNDVSGLRDPELAERLRADRRRPGADAHAPPRRANACRTPDLYEDVTAEVLDFLRVRIELALEPGIRREQLIVDPGPDFAKTPAQTIRLLAAAEAPARARTARC